MKNFCKSKQKSDNFAKGFLDKLEMTGGKVAPVKMTNLSFRLERNEMEWNGEILV